MQALTRITLITLLLIISTTASAISYTVQVVAVSTESTALRLQQQLGAQGYPAYLISVPTPQGTVYRLRVGAFANRAAADTYAKTMQTNTDTQPTPALAEGIPEGLIPLEANQLAAYTLDNTRVTATTWEDMVVVKAMPEDALQGASYTVFTADGVQVFNAWAAVRQEDGSIVRFYRFDLWPANWSELSEDEKTQFRTDTLAAVATSLGLTPAQVAAFQYEDTAGVPFLALAERFNLSTGERTRMRALGQPGEGFQDGVPGMLYFSGETPVTPQETSSVFDSALTVDATTIAGDGWEAVTDGVYARLQVSGSSRGWRAAVGKPVWGRDNVLLSVHNDTLYVYQLQKR